MGNHFRAIGLEIDDESDAEEFALRTADLGESIAVDGGHYSRWVAGAGAELWAYVDSEGRIMGLDPHFAGGATMRVALTERVVPSAERPWEGCFHGWAAPETDDPESGQYPFLFAAPDLLAWQALPLPATVEVGVSAFAHELRAYASEQAFLDGQEGEMKFAAESFIPSGLFVDEGGTPAPLAIFTGRVLETEIRSVPDSWRGFVRARVRTLGGEVEVVAEPEVVEGEVVVGGIVTGSFWLSGRIAGAPPPPSIKPTPVATPWWKRLLGR